MGFRSTSPRTSCVHRPATVAVEGFETAMARQREEARKSWIGSGGGSDGGGLVRFAR